MTAKIVIPAKRLKMPCATNKLHRRLQVWGLSDDNSSNDARQKAGETNNYNVASYRCCEWRIPTKCLIVVPSILDRSLFGKIAEFGRNHQPQ